MVNEEVMDKIEEVMDKIEVDMVEEEIEDHHQSVNSED